MATTQIFEPGADFQRLAIPAVTWAEYLGFSALLDERHVRLTYDRGELELMTLSFGHEGASRLLNRAVEILSEELELPLAQGGSTTLRREDVDRGLEPDECYWIAHEPAVRSKPAIDLNIDPPPDLAIEVDISRSSIDRQAIYAALGVPELWRFDGDRVQFLALEAGDYVPRPTSLAFPSLSADEFNQRLAESATIDTTRWARDFRRWVRQEILPRHGQPPA